MSLRSLFSRFMDNLCPPAPPAEVPPPHPEPPVPPKPSCFALGIAHSIKTEPKAWKTVDDDSYHTTGWSSVLSIKHQDTGVLLRASQSHYGPPCYRLTGCQWINYVSIAEHGLTDAEVTLIAQTLEAHPLGQLKTLIDTKRRETARKAAAETHFARLGCPSDSR